MTGIIFVTEFITGGGSASETLDRTLFPEGFSMLHGIIKALRRQDYEVLTTLDQRELWISDLLDADVTPVRTNTEYYNVITELAKKADHVICIAPESHGILEKVVSLLKGANDIGFYGPDRKAVRKLSNKLEFARYCQDKNIKHPETLLVKHMSKDVLETAFEDLETDKIVSKPLLGAGCERIKLHSPENFHLIPEIDEQDLIIQPYLDGQHFSATFMTVKGKILLLSINEQDIVVDGKIRYNGGSYPAFDERRRAIPLPLDVKKLADAIVHDYKIRGFFGIDFTRQGKTDYVIEVNLRPTTPLASILNNAGLNLKKIMTLENSVSNSNQPDAAYPADLENKLAVFRKITLSSNAVLSNRILKELFRNNHEMLSPLFPLSNLEQYEEESMVSYVCLVASTGKNRIFAEKKILKVKSKLQTEIDQHYR